MEPFLFNNIFTYFHFISFHISKSTYVLLHLKAKVVGGRNQFIISSILDDESGFKIFLLGIF